MKEERKERKGFIKEGQKKRRRFYMAESQKENKEEENSLIKDNRGIGIVEIILILVILIALVLLFQTQIKDIVTRALESISNNANSIIN